MNRSETLVLDTHVWIWLVTDAPELDAAVAVTIGDAARTGSVLVPAIAAWEVAMLARRGRIALAEPAALWVTRALAAPGLALAPLTPEIAVESCNLPDAADSGAVLADPADRMIVATARIMDGRIVTRDRRILAYGAAGHVAVLAA